MNILTFDIEDWFHILDNDSTRTETEWSKYESRLLLNVEKIIELLEEQQLRATFFCLGWVARQYPEVIKRISGLGYEVGSHSSVHQLVFEQNRVEFHKDLRMSVDTIQEVTGEKVRAFRAPGFSFTRENKWAFEVLAENGIEIDCSVFPAKRAHGGFEHFEPAAPTLVETNGLVIKEFPINLFHIPGYNIIFSGGGYFRLLPYSLIKKFMERSDYVMTYFHPRDFDPDQPIIKELPLIRKFKSYYGLRNAFSKLELLTRDFRFIDLAEADKLVDWNKTKIVRLNEII